MLLGLLAVPACSGGGGGGSTPTGLSARFTAANPNPGADTVSMAAGSTSGPAFQVQIVVTAVSEFFGAAFQVVYDPARAAFTGFDCSGSLLPPPPDRDCRADGGTPGVVLVDATMLGQRQGVDVTGPAQLLALTFRATSATAGSAFDFDGAAPRVVRTCPAPPGACSDVPNVTWSGGTLTAN